MTANFNEDSPGSECQLSSKIYKTSGRIEGRSSKTSRSKQNRRIRS